MRICPGCHSSFLPATKFPALRRLLDRESREAWLKALRSETTKATVNFSGAKCLDHQQNLEQGDIPDYVIPGWIPSCCQLQHLSPEQMCRVLEIGLQSESPVLRREKRGMAHFLGGILYRIFGEKQEKDVMQGFVFSMRIKPILDNEPE